MKPKHSSIQLIQQQFNTDIVNINFINGSGSNRRYFRVWVKQNESYILTENDFIAENDSFLYLTDLFSQHQCCTPKIIATNNERTAYIQNDLGNTSLLDTLQQQSYTDKTYNLFEKSLEQLALLQIKLHNNIDFSKYYDFNSFDQKVVFNDLFYFKNYFLDRLDLPYSKSRLIDEITQLATQTKNLKQQFFLYRDFQSRNIMINQDTPYFIDYQGGMRGFIGYDLVSFIFQAKAQLPQHWRTSLTKRYFEYFTEHNLLSLEELKTGYHLAMILRFFQVFGSYGLRGLVEKKTHFISSIFLNMDNIKHLLKHSLLSNYPELKSISEVLISDAIKIKLTQLIQS